MIKLKNVELSVLLSAHEAGALARLGSLRGKKLCMVEAVEKLPQSCSTFSGDYAEDFVDIAVDWFDDNYEESWTDDEFLAELREAGFV